MTTTKEKSRYVVALNSEGRRFHKREELLRLLTDDARISIVEGAGRNAVTVMMTPQVGWELSQKLSYATVEPVHELKLLAT